MQTFKTFPASKLVLIAISTCYVYTMYMQRNTVNWAIKWVNRLNLCWDSTLLIPDSSDSYPHFYELMSSGVPPTSNHESEGIRVRGVSEYSLVSELMLRHNVKTSVQISSRVESQQRWCNLGHVISTWHHWYVLHVCCM